MYYSIILTDEFFEKLEINRKKSIENHEITRDLGYYLSNADEAWRVKDYQTVTKFLLPLRGSILLSNAYKKKLEYAMSRISS
jgi:hypothetical protein